MWAGRVPTVNKSPGLDSDYVEREQGVRHEWPLNHKNSKTVHKNH